MSKVSEPQEERLSPKRWQLLKNIVADALEENSPAARTALVESRCAGDMQLRAEAESLVRQGEKLEQDPTDSLEDCAEQATAALWKDEAPRKGWRIGAYVVERELGRGGMGSVYQAARADGQFEKEVAIKVLKRGTDTEEVLRRFAAERHILARLDHSNIARLLDAGTTDDGLPYFVMEYVSGAPVTRFVRDHNLSIPARLALFLKVCAAVEVAHHNHVIHRDLKPSNILVNAEGEPKLLDFGIAKLLGPGQDCLELTAAGEERLTPNCASPEQTDGRPVTEASDVYALGGMLYEILSGEKPHQFSTPHPMREEIVRVIRDIEPLPPSAVVANKETARTLRGDLDAIVAFAMRKEPAMRYKTVADLAADVRRNLAHEPVLARQGTAGYRTKSLLARHGQTVRVLAAAGALLLLAGAFFAFWYRTRQSLPGLEPSPKSIAVLPFDNFAKDESSYFADGVQDNILTDLGKVADLKVISRNAVAAYRGKTSNAREIGRELGVGNILVGSVQRSGNRVRINAQLIDARTDTQIWAEHYDRKVEDIFALQSELAQTIVAQLKVTLTSREKAVITKRPTEDLEAYDLYLRARAALNRAGPFDPKKSWGDAVKLVNQAIERDRNFALAYCVLNEAQVYIYRFGLEHSPVNLEAAKQAAETALKLQPELEEARLAMARYYYHGLHDSQQTIDQLSMLPASAAHESEYYTLAGLAKRRLGHWAESVRDSEKAVELDPRNPHAVGNLMQTYSGLRRYAEARRLGEATVRLLPADVTDRLWLLKSESELAEGNLEAARLSLENMSTKEGSDYQVARIWLCLLQRDFSTADRALENVSEEGEATAGFWLVAGMIRRLEGDDDEARRSFLAARNLTESALQRRFDSAELLSELAEADLGLGENEEAAKEAARSVELAPPALDALTAPSYVMRLAQTQAARGDIDGALKALQEQVRVPFGPTYGDLKFNPAWDNLRNDSRFPGIVAESSQPLHRE